MFYYIYMQPDIFSEALTEGEDATQIVVSILNGFMQNCFLSVFVDNYWEESVKNILDSWPENMNRKRIKTILKHLKKNKRMIYNLYFDYDTKKRHIECVFDQIKNADLDLILLIESEADKDLSGGIEITTRSHYLHTNFEKNRSGIVVNGKTCISGQMDENKFMNFHFKKALKYATKIDIYDHVCGKTHLSNNFKYTIGRFMNWFGKTNVDHDNCKISFHFAHPSKKGEDFVLTKLRSIKHKFITNTAVSVYFYDDSYQKLPHQRFILSDQIALNVERGLDFLDNKTQKCRDTYVNYQSLKDAREIIRSISKNYISKHDI